MLRGAGIIAPAGPYVNAFYAPQRHVRGSLTQANRESWLTLKEKGPGERPGHFREKKGGGAPAGKVSSLLSSSAAAPAWAVPRETAWTPAAFRG